MLLKELFSDDKEIVNENLAFIKFLSKDKTYKAFVNTIEKYVEDMIDQGIYKDSRFAITEISDLIKKDLMKQL